MKLTSVFAAIALFASIAFAQVFTTEYPLSVNKAEKTLNITGDPETTMIHVCDRPMFPGGDFLYVLGEDTLTLKFSAESDGVTFKHVSGPVGDVYATWGAATKEMKVELTLSPEKLTVVSECAE